MVFVYGIRFLLQKNLQDEGYSVEVIDLRTIIPLDTETIFNSVRKTNKAVIIHEDTLTGGFGGEIAARISEFCFEQLDGPVKENCCKRFSHSVFTPARRCNITKPYKNLPRYKRIIRVLKGANFYEYCYAKNGRKYKRRNHN